MKLYLIIVEGGTEISRSGPYGAEDARLEDARDIWAAQGSETLAIFKLDIHPDCTADVWPFVGDELDLN